MAKLGDGWLRRGDGWLSRGTGGQVVRWTARRVATTLAVL